MLGLLYCICFIVYNINSFEKAGEYMSKFLQGTIILIIAGFITKILGFVNRIVIARLIGEEGVGLYMMAVPTFILAITITQLGLPVAISKLVAEAEIKGDRARIKKVLVVSLSITLSISLIFTTAMLFFAPAIAQTLLTDERTYYPLMAIIPVIPIIAVSAVIRGYFQGRQQMRPAAYSQIIEQVVRITLVAFCITLFAPYGVEYAAAGAMLSSVFGELASLLYMVYTFKKKKRVKVRKRFFHTLKGGKEPLYDLLKIALPTTGGRMIGSLSWFLEPIVVTHSLAIAGVATALATKQYGMLAGFALPVLMLPSFITNSLSTSLVPAISEAAAENKNRLIQYRLHQALRLSFLTGGLSVVVLYVFAQPIMLLMYGTVNGAFFIQIMAPLFIFYYLQGPLQATLQALNLAQAAMINSLIGAIAKLSLIFALATQPHFGIKGAALGIMAGMTIVTFLHLATVIKAISFVVYIRDYIKSFIVMVITGVAGHYIYETIPSSVSLSLRTIFSIIVLSLIYIILLKGFRLVSQEELRRFSPLRFIKKHTKR